MSQIVWWEIETRSPDVCREFHGTLWGWSFRPAFGDTGLGADYWIIEAEGRGIGGLQRAATDRPPHAGTRVYVEVSDLEATLGRVESLGGQVERARTELGGDDRWFAIALDPTGVSFGLWTANPVTS
ncbi:MAG TPA: VOC family protein [Candidatus Limnocylindrales bacterium]